MGRPRQQTSLLRAKTPIEAARKAMIEVELLRFPLYLRQKAINAQGERTAAVGMLSGEESLSIERNRKPRWRRS